jgi:multicomponent Na+:H+ antiporter subunit E
VKSRTVLFVFCLVIWLLLSWPADWQHLVVGVVVSLLVTLITGDMFVGRPRMFGHVGRYLWFLYYIPVFVWECLKANVDVALRVIHPDLPIKPGIVRAKTRLKSETGLTFLANSITLTPGTLSVDVDRENGFLYIHWINVRTTDTQQATQLIVEKFERILAHVFE